MLKLLTENLGTILVLIVLGLVIYWAVKELLNQRVSCTSCPLHKRCQKNSRKCGHAAS